MARVIAMQEIQLQMLGEDHKKNISVVSETKEQTNIINQNISMGSPIDMETQGVNLNVPNENNKQVTNVESTNQVFGTSNDPVYNNAINVPYLEPSEVKDIPNPEMTEIKEIPKNVLSDETYFELLNSLRNMITDFANNAYSAIDRFQEERLQGKTSGVDLIKGTDIVKNANIQESPLTENIDNNKYNDQTIDLDKTIVLPANFVANNVVEPENEFKMVA